MVAGMGERSGGGSVAATGVVGGEVPASFDRFAKMSSTPSPDPGVEAFEAFGCGADGCSSILFTVLVSILLQLQPGW